MKSKPCPTTSDRAALSCQLRAAHTKLLGTTLHGELGPIAVGCFLIHAPVHADDRFVRTEHLHG